MTPTPPASPRSSRSISSSREDGEQLALTPVATALETAPGAGGLRTLRLDVTYRAELPRPAGALAFRDRNFADRPGWQEVVVTPAGGARLSGATVPGSDVSHALRAYPEDMLQAPLRVSEARAQLAPGGTVESTASASPAGTRSGPERFGDRFTALLTDPAPLGAWTIVTSLLVAAMLGAFHALTPGHGKTIVGAYLVGSRGTARHAVFLGLVVTLTHTLGVYLLGLGTLAASAWVVPERLYPWISVLSGLLVVGVGASLVTSRLVAARAHDHHHDHAHGHDHAHEDTTMRTIISTGTSTTTVTPTPTATRICRRRTRPSRCAACSPSACRADCCPARRRSW